MNSKIYFFPRPTTPSLHRVCYDSLSGIIKKGDLASSCTVFVMSLIFMTRVEVRCGGTGCGARTSRVGPHIAVARHWQIFFRRRRVENVVRRSFLSQRRACVRSEGLSVRNHAPISFYHNRGPRRAFCSRSISTPRIPSRTRETSYSVLRRFVSRGIKCAVRRTGVTTTHEETILWPSCRCRTL